MVYIRARLLTQSQELQYHSPRLLLLERTTLRLSYGTDNIEVISMSFILKNNGLVVASSGAWNPRLFAQHTGTSFPAIVSDEYTWANEGYTLAWEDDPVTPPPKVYITVTPRQIRQALTIAQLRTQVEAAVMGASQNVKDWWEFATSFEENHPEVVAMASAIGVGESALHELFVLAETL